MVLPTQNVQFALILQLKGMCDQKLKPTDIRVSDFYAARIPQSPAKRCEPSCTCYLRMLSPARKALLQPMVGRFVPCCKMVRETPSGALTSRRQKLWCYWEVGWGYHASTYPLVKGNDAGWRSGHGCDPVLEKAMEHRSTLFLLPVICFQSVLSFLIRK